LSFLIVVVNFVAQILIWVLIGRAILSWFANPYYGNRGGSLARFYSVLVQVTEPLVRPARKLLSRFNTGPMDFSLFVTILLIIVVRQVLIRVLLFLA
jgi:YggT family protein